jgi:hypothetical protein
MKKLLKFKRLWLRDSDVTARMGRQASIGAAVEFWTRASLGFAHG